MSAKNLRQWYDLLERYLLTISPARAAGAKFMAMGTRRRLIAIWSPTGEV